MKMADYAAPISPYMLPPHETFAANPAELVETHTAPLFASAKFGVAIIVSGSPTNIGPAALIVGIARPLAIYACSSIMAS
jgi:hypothetical protein